MTYTDQADRHPEMRRMASDPRALLDPAYRLSLQQMRQFLTALYRALDVEHVEPRLAERIVAQVVYQRPETPLAALEQVAHVDRARHYRLRGGLGDGQGPLMPGDVVRDQIPVRIDDSVPPALREKIVGALGGLDDDAQARWLLEGGEERHHLGGPPPNAAAESAYVPEGGDEDAETSEPEGS